MSTTAAIQRCRRERLGGGGGAGSVASAGGGGGAGSVACADGEGGGSWFTSAAGATCVGSVFLGAAT